MIVFKVVERVLGVGPRKGQKAYGAEPKAPLKFSQEWLIDRIVRETSLSEGDVRNVLIGDGFAFLLGKVLSSYWERSRLLIGNTIASIL